MAQLGFHYDMTACTGCKVCQVACKDKNNLKVGTLFRRVQRFEGGKFPQPWIYYLSTTCHHCEKPGCTANCPTGAMHKRPEDGVVLVDQDKCIGCRYCMWSCPYGIPQFITEKGKVNKCDFCSDLIAEKKEPACVAACPMRTLHYGPIEEIQRKFGGTADVIGLPDATLTRPSDRITPKPQAKR